MRNDRPEPYRDKGTLGLHRLALINFVIWGLFAVGVLFALRRAQLDDSVGLERSIPAFVRPLLLPRGAILFGMLIVTFLGVFLAPAALLGAASLVGVLLTEAANRQFWIQERQTRRSMDSPPSRPDDPRE